MKTQHVFSASAAAVLVVSTAAFAQAPQSASPSSQAGQQTTTQASRQPETPVTLVGCVMREPDYRKSTDSGRGGPLATGLGSGNEFVLVNAMKTTAGSAAPSSAAECGT